MFYTDLEKSFYGSTIFVPFLLSSTVDVFLSNDCNCNHINNVGWYIFASGKGQYPVRYGQVMLIGPARVGKTGLRHGLMNMPLASVAKSTCTLAEVKRIQCNLGKAIGKTYWKAFTEDDDLRIHHADVDDSEKLHYNVLNVWDWRGHPVIMELVLAFLNPRTMFLLCFDASQELSERSLIFGDAEGMVQLSTIDILVKWVFSIVTHLARIDSDNCLLSYPRILPVGTHGDRLQVTEKSVAELSKIFADHILGVASSFLLCPVIVNNTTAGTAINEDPTFEKIRHLIDDFIAEVSTVPTPVNWLLFCKTLQEVHPQRLSLKEAVELGVDNYLQSDEVPSALKFFHELGVLLFYSFIKGLENVVITDPNWLLNELGKIFDPKYSREFGSQSLWALLDEKGLLLEPLYKLAWRDCGVDPDAIIELLLHYKIAIGITISPEVHELASLVRAVFIPGMLPYWEKEQSIVSLKYFKKSAPLHITFSSQYVPKRFYVHLIESLASQHKWKVNFSSKMFCNRISFNFDEVDLVVITELKHSIQVEVFRCAPSNHTLQPFSLSCQQVLLTLDCSCNAVQRFIEQSRSDRDPIMDHIIKPLSFTSQFSFVCPCESSNIKPHYMYISPDQKAHHYVMCTNGSFYQPTEEQDYWLCNSKLVSTIVATVYIILVCLHVYTTTFLRNFHVNISRIHWSAMKLN